MKKHNVEIFESNARVIEVEAEDKEDAIAQVERRYKRGEIVLDSSDFENVEFKIL